MKKENNKESIPAAEPIDLETHHIFLDTQVYRSMNFNPENPVLKELISYIERGQLVLYITDITFCEIQRQIREAVDRIRDARRKAQKDINYWIRRVYSETKEDRLEVDYEHLTTSVVEKFMSAFRFEIQKNMIPASTINAESIFKDYFARKPPFDKLDSKEFPDAFVVRALDMWCSRKKIKMYAVTADNAFRRAVEITENLLPIKNISEILQAVATVEKPQDLSFVQKFLGRESINASITQSLETALGNIAVVYTGDLAEGEADSVDINGDISISNFSILSHGAYLSVVLDISVPLKTQIIY